MSIRTSDQSPDLDGPQPAAGWTAPAAQTDGLVGGGGSGGGVRCESCGVPVEVTQRYCVECGAHRVGVNDPAAAYMNRAPVRSQRTRAVVVSSRRSRLISALMLALIPVAVAVGVLIGRSSNNRDPALLQAIRHSRAEVVTVQSPTAQVVTIASGHQVIRTTSKQSVTQSAAGSTARSQAVGATQTKSQQQQSAKIVKKLQTTNGLGYLDPITSQVGGGG